MFSSFKFSSIFLACLDSSCVMFTDSTVVIDAIEEVVIVEAAVILVVEVALEPSTPEIMMRLLTVYLFSGLCNVNI